jgi:hypothetical protein
MRKCIAFDFILLYQRTFYLLFPINYFLKMYRVSFILGVYSPEMKYTKRSAIGCIFQCSFTGNEMYKTKLPLLASKEKHVGKKHYLFLHKDFDRSKKLSQFTFNRQNVFFWLTPCDSISLWQRCRWHEPTYIASRKHCARYKSNKCSWSICGYKLNTNDSISIF